jgi:hypothetical protein
MINFNLLGIRIISTMDTKTEDRHISTVYFSTDGKWQDGPELKKGDTVVLTVGKTWPDICWFYANIIDYFRCYLAIVALVVILYTPEQKILIGCLIMWMGLACRHSCIVQSGNLGYSTAVNYRSFCGHLHYS